MRSEFPLVEIDTDIGALPDPTIDLPVKTPAGHRVLGFLLDTGGDFTMLPLAMAEEFGVDIEDAPEMTVEGIGGERVPALLAEVSIMIGEAEVQLPWLYCLNESTPYLLGRMGLFQRFNITFDNARKKIVLEEIGQ